VERQQEEENPASENVTKMKEVYGGTVKVTSLEFEAALSQRFRGETHF